MARYKRIGLAVVLIAAMALAMSGCASKTVDAPAATKPVAPATGSSASKAAMTGHTLISITDAGFVPAKVTVSAGTKVVWTNDGKVDHNVTPDSGGATSGKIKPGVTAVHQFTSTGTYHYHDNLHPELKGTIIVH